MNIVNEIINSISEIRENVSKLDLTLTALIQSLEEFSKHQSRQPIKLENFIGLDEDEKEDIISNTNDPVIIMLLTEQVLIKKNT